MPEEVSSKITLDYSALVDAVREVGKQLRQVDKVSDEAAAAIGKGLSDAFTQAGKSAQATAQVMPTLRDQLTQVGNAASKMGQSLSAGLTLPLAAIGKMATDMSASFETAMANVWTIADVTERELQGLGDQVARLSTQVPQSATQLAEGLYDAIGSGITDVGDAMYALEIAAKAGMAGASNTATAMDAITTVLNSYGLAVTETANITDQMFRTVDRGKISFGELAGSVAGVASTAATAGVGFDQIAASFATLTKGGVAASEASTAVNQVLLSIIQPASAAADFAEQLGIEFNATALASKGLSGVLQDVYEATGGNIESVASLFSNVRALKGALGLIRNDMKDFTDDLDAMGSSSGATEAAFQKQMQTSAAQSALFKNEVAALARAFGDELLPILNEAMSSLRPVIQAFQALPEGTREAVVGFGIFAAALGPVIAGLGAVIGFITGPAGWVVALGAAAAAIYAVTRNATDLDGKLERQTRAAQDSAREWRASADAAIAQAKANRDQGQALKALLAEYEKLAGKPDKSEAEHKRLQKVMEDIIKLQPDIAAGYDDIGTAIERNLPSIQNMAEAMVNQSTLILQAKANEALINKGVLAAELNSLNASLKKDMLDLEGDRSGAGRLSELTYQANAALSRIKLYESIDPRNISGPQRDSYEQIQQSAIDARKELALILKEWNGTKLALEDDPGIFVVKLASDAGKAAAAITNLTNRVEATKESIKAVQDQIDVGDQLIRMEAERQAGRDPFAIQATPSVVMAEPPVPVPPVQTPVSATNEALQRALATFKDLLAINDEQVDTAEEQIAWLEKNIRGVEGLLTLDRERATVNQMIFDIASTNADRLAEREQWNAEQRLNYLDDYLAQYAVSYDQIQELEDQRTALQAEKASDYAALQDENFARAQQMYEMEIASLEAVTGQTITAAEARRRYLALMNQYGKTDGAFSESALQANAAMELQFMAMAAAEQRKYTDDQAKAAQDAADAEAKASDEAYRKAMDSYHERTVGLKLSTEEQKRIYNEAVNEFMPTAIKRSFEATQAIQLQNLVFERKLNDEAVENTRIRLEAEQQIKLNDMRQHGTERTLAVVKAEQDLVNELDRIKSDVNLDEATRNKLNEAAHSNYATRLVEIERDYAAKAYQINANLSRRILELNEDTLENRLALLYNDKMRDIDLVGNAGGDLQSLDTLYAAREVKLRKEWAEESDKVLFESKKAFYDELDISGTSLSARLDGYELLAESMNGSTVAAEELRLEILRLKAAQADLDADSAALANRLAKEASVLQATISGQIKEQRDAALELFDLETKTQRRDLEDRYKDAPGKATTLSTFDETRSKERALLVKEWAEKEAQARIDLAVQIVADAEAIDGMTSNIYRQLDVYKLYAATLDQTTDAAKKFNTTIAELETQKIAQDLAIAQGAMSASQQAGIMQAERFNQTELAQLRELAKLSTDHHNRVSQLYRDYAGNPLVESLVESTKLLYEEERAKMIKGFAEVNAQAKIDRVTEYYDGLDASTSTRLQGYKSNYELLDKDTEAAKEFAKAIAELEKEEKKLRQSAISEERSIVTETMVLQAALYEDLPKQEKAAMQLLSDRTKAQKDALREQYAGHVELNDLLNYVDQRYLIEKQTIEKEYATRRADAAYNDAMKEYQQRILAAQKAVGTFDISTGMQKQLLTEVLVSFPTAKMTKEAQAAITTMFDEFDITLSEEATAKIKTDAEANARTIAKEISDMEDLSRVSIKAARERLLAERETYDGMGEAGEGAVNIIQKALDELTTTERNMHDMRTLWGRMNTQEQLDQVNEWLAASKKGTNEWKALYSEAFALLGELNKEAAQTTTDSLMSEIPVDTQKIIEVGNALSSVSEALSAYYNEAKQGGPEMAGAANIYLRALDDINRQLTDNMRAQKDAADAAQRVADNEAKHTYDKAQQDAKTVQDALSAAETYYSYLTTQRTAMEALGAKHSDTWLRVDRDIERVDSTRQQRRAELFVEQIGMMHEVEEAELESTRTKLEAELEKYDMMGVAGEAAYGVIQDALGSLGELEEAYYKQALANSEDKTKVELDRVQKLITREKEGSAEYLQLKARETDLLIRQQTELARAAVDKQGDITTSSRVGLIEARNSLGVAMTSAEAMGIKGAEATKIYGDALSRVNEQIDRLDQRQSELDLTKLRIEYEDDPTKGGQAYRDELEKRLQSTEQYASDWQRIRNELARVDMELNERAAQSWVDSQGEMGQMSLAELDALKTAAQARQAHYTGLGEAGRNAARVVGTALADAYSIQKRKFEDLVDEGKLTLDQQISWVSLWRDAAQEGSQEYLTLSKELRALQEQLQVTGAKTSIASILGDSMPDTITGLETAREQLGMLYDAAKGGKYTADALSEIERALSNVNTALERAIADTTRANTKQARAQVESAKYLSKTNLLAAIDSLDAWLTTTAGIGEMWDDARDVVEKALRDMRDQSAEAGAEIKRQLLEPFEQAIADINRKTEERKSSAQTGDGTDLTAEQIEQLRQREIADTTEKYITSRIGSVERMRDAEVAAAHLVLDEVQKILATEVDEESKAALFILAIRTQLNNRTRDLNAQREQDAYRLRKHFGTLTVKEQIDNEMAIAFATSQKDDERTNAAIDYYSAIKGLMADAKIDELATIRETLQAQLSKYEEMGEEGSALALAIRALLKLLKDETILAMSDMIGQIAGAFSDLAGLFGADSDVLTGIENLGSAAEDAAKAYIAFTAGDMAGAAASATSALVNLDSAIANLSPTIRNAREEAAKLGKAISESLSGLEQFGERSSTIKLSDLASQYQEALEDWNKAADQQTDAGFVQRFWWWLTGSAPDAGADAGREYAQAFIDAWSAIGGALESGFDSAISSGIKAFLDGTDTIANALREGIRSAIVEAITQAVVQGAIIQGAIGSLLTRFTDELALKQWEAAAATISLIAAQIPEIAGQLEQILAPFTDALDTAFPGIGPGASKGNAGTQISEITGPTRDMLIETLRPLQVLDNLPIYAAAMELAIYEMRDAFLAYLGMKAATEAGLGAVHNEYNINTINIYSSGEQDFDQLMESLGRRADLAMLGSGE